MAGDVRTSVDVPLGPRRAFEAFADELSLGLEARGMKTGTLSRGAEIVEGGAKAGTVEDWVPGKRIKILWHPKTWEPDTAVEFVVTFAPTKGGTRVTTESRGWGRAVGGDAPELLGWYAGEVVAPLLSASAPGRLGDWITDRHARRPFGAKSRETYENPLYHWPNFLAILNVLSLKPEDDLLEVGCGGGAFLREALKSGCRASAIDHSPDMVRLASRTNSGSVAKGRLRVEVGDAESLPYPDGTFTCAVMTGVLGFVPDAPKAFREVSRVLRGGGRFVAFTSTKELRGTPAAPEPMASRLRFYEDDELERMARSAGFEARVEHRSLFEFAKKAGIPRSDLPLFKGTGGSQLLVCHKR